MDIEYEHTPEDRSNKEPKISNKLKMNPPKWEMDSVSFPQFNPTNIISSQVVCCDVLNINKNVIVTDERLQDTSNNMECYLAVDVESHKILVDINIELCNTDNTVHLLDMKASREYSVRDLEDVLKESTDSQVEISGDFARFITLYTLLPLNPKLKKVHRLLDVTKLNLNMICGHYNFSFITR